MAEHLGVDTLPAEIFDEARDLVAEEPLVPQSRLKPSWLRDQVHVLGIQHRFNNDVPCAIFGLHTRRAGRLLVILMEVVQACPV